MITDKRIDGGKGFDFGRTSEDYAKYRDIYPKEFYTKILEYGLCEKGKKVLDIGTGTGVLPINLYGCGAEFTGTDISENQIETAKRLALENNMNINFLAVSSENMTFGENSFDTITACQCFFYFDHEQLMPELYKILKPDGSLAVLYMAWLPDDDKIAGETEKLILKYNPSWTGKAEKRHPIDIPEIYNDKFQLIKSEVFDLKVPFTRESWNGRIRACRGIGASLGEEEIKAFEKEHMDLLGKIAPESFDILHYAAVKILRPKK